MAPDAAEHDLAQLNAALQALRSVQVFAHLDYLRRPRTIRQLVDHFNITDVATRIRMRTLRANGLCTQSRDEIPATYAITDRGRQALELGKDLASWARAVGLAGGSAPDPEAAVDFLAKPRITAMLIALRDGPMNTVDLTKHLGFGTTWSATPHWQALLNARLLQITQDWSYSGGRGRTARVLGLTDQGRSALPLLQRLTNWQNETAPAAAAPSPRTAPTTSSPQDTSPPQDRTRTLSETARAAATAASSWPAPAASIDRQIEETTHKTLDQLRDDFEHNQEPGLHSVLLHQRDHLVAAEQAVADSRMRLIELAGEHTGRLPVAAIVKEASQLAQATAERDTLHNALRSTLAATRRDAAATHNARPCARTHHDLGDRCPGAPGAQPLPRTPSRRRKL
ncbi:hypothetical protein BIV57_22690 [Mangrovactinospora gilvigrisea]|uniref:Uncharacterized protein n=1 Tax=Mangrovactinospora gilvigrisea TaxID=1428644 RepID=A0A1J7C0X9_9ACTN|nr:hypothetical protein [Mangrovactinospora gilvigrisea]OIV35232.1 hypothetical protein BIV57_22690 [Mangrovactinospora gilvigrisea]